MKKILPVALLALLVIASVISPKLISTQFETRLTEALEQINQSPPYKATLVSFESSWFGAEGTIIIGIDGDSLADANDVNTEFELAFQTTYGPFLFSDAGMMGVYAIDIIATGEQLREIITWDQDAPFYKMAIAEGFTGNISMSDKIPEFSDLDSSFSFSGYQGGGNADSNETTYRGEVGTVTIMDGDNTLAANDVVINLQANVPLADSMKISLYDSETLFSIGELTSNQGLNAKNVTLFSYSKLDEETQLGSLDFGTSIEKIDSDAYSANDISLVMTLDKVSNDAFKMLEQLTNTAALSPQEATGLLNEMVTKLLLAEPVFSTELKGSIPEGNINVSLTSQLKELSGVSLAVLSTPQFWIFNSFVDAEANVDKAAGDKIALELLAIQTGIPSDAPQLIQHTSSVIDGLVSQGLIIKNDEQYTTRLLLENGQSTINGQPVPIF